MLDYYKNNSPHCRAACSALFLVIFAFILCVKSASAQVGQYMVLLPTHITSGKYAGDYDIKGAKVQGDGYVAWGNTAPKPLCEMPVREFWPSAISDGSGGIIAGYTIEHIDSENLGDRDILIRRLDSDGNDLWANDETGPVLVVAQSSQFEEHPQLVPISDGVLVFYEVRYRDGDHTGDVDVAAVRVAMDGTIAWENAIWIANSNKFERIAGVCSDGKGNGLVLIETNAGEGLDTNRSLTLYRVKPDGSLGWDGTTGNEIAIAGSSHDERNGVIAPDGTGGAYIAYEIRYTSGARKGDIDIIAQHVSSNGVRSWIDPAAPPIVSSNARALERAPSIAVDSIGIIVSFEMDFQPDSLNTRSRPLRVVGVQRLDKNGKAVWNSGERAQVILAKNRVVDRPLSIADKSGDAFIVLEGWDSATGDRDIFIQKLDEKGERQWGEKGYAVPVFNGPMPEQKATAFPDNYGGLIVIAVQPAKYRVASSGTPPSDSTIVAQRMNDLGKPVWGEGEGNLIVARCDLGDYGPTVVQSK